MLGLGLLGKCRGEILPDLSFCFVLCDTLRCAPLHFNKTPNVQNDGDWRDLLSLHQNSGCVLRNSKTLLVKALSLQKGLITWVWRTTGRLNIVPSNRLMKGEYS